MCIKLTAHVKDPVVHVRVRWITETEVPHVHKDHIPTLKIL